MEAWITRHVFRITGPQCCDQPADALMLLTGVPDEGLFLVVGLVDTGRVKHGLFYERIEFQGDQHVGSHLLSQAWITDVLIVLEQVSHSLVISFEHRHGLFRLVQNISLFSHSVISFH